MKYPHLSHSSQLATAIAALLAAQAVKAANQTWDGGPVSANANWSNVDNWNGAVPGATSGTTNTDIATFDAAIVNGWGTNLTPILIDSTTQNIGGITFAATAGSYFIGATTNSNSLLLSNGGTIGMSSGTTSQIETINAPLVIEGSSYNFSNNSSNGTLKFNGNITGASGTPILTLSGSNANSNIIGEGQICIIANGDATSLGVTKTGVGTWAFEGANTFSGQLTVEEGVLQIQSINNISTQGSLGKSANPVILGKTGGFTGLLEISSPSNTATPTKTFTLAGGGSGAFRITSSSANITLDGVIDGGGSLIKDGPGALTLRAANTYSGNTTISQGTLNAGIGEASKPFGTNTAAGSIIFNGGTLQYSTVNVNDYSARLTATNNAAYSIDTNSQAVTFSNALLAAGTSGLTKSGLGSLTLGTNASTYTGLTTVSGGDLKLGVANAIKSGNAVTVSNVTAGQTATLDLNGYAQTIGTATVSGLTLGGSYTTSTAQVIGTNSTLTLAGTTKALTYDAANNPVGASISTTAINLNGVAQTFTIGDSTTAAYDLSISSGITNGSLTKAGLGTLKLTGASDYAGATLVTAGILNIQNSTATGTTAVGVTVSNLAALELQGGGIAVGAEALSISGEGFNGAGGALRNVSGVNSYAGAITLAAAARINSDANTLTLGGTIKGNFGLTVGGAGNTLINGVIGSTSSPTSLGSLTKDGAGTVTLTAANIYRGSTNVAAGNLVVNGSLNLYAEVTVGGGPASSEKPTLAGYGTINRPTSISGTVDISNPLEPVPITGGTHSPGGRTADGTASLVGVQTFNEALTYGNGSIFEWQLTSNTVDNRGVEFDGVDVGNSSVTIDDAAVFKIVIGSSVSFNPTVDTALFWNVDRSWQVFGDGATAIGTGSFLVIDAPTASYTPYYPGGGFSFDSSNGTLNWTAVPEPTSASAGLLVGAGLLRRKRGRKVEN